jgi:hypothetical protein
MNITENEKVTHVRLIKTNATYGNTPVGMKEAPHPFTGKKLQQYSSHEHIGVTCI